MKYTHATSLLLSLHNAQLHGMSCLRLFVSCFQSLGWQPHAEQRGALPQHALQGRSLGYPRYCVGQNGDMHRKTCPSSAMLFCASCSRPHGGVLHDVQCAGTSLRQIFMAWAAQKGWDGYIAEYCPQPHFNVRPPTLSGQIHERRFADRVHEEFRIMQFLT